MYKMRNYPCTFGEFFVAGASKNFGDGILEWCCDENDANYVLDEMKKYPEEFSNLEIGKWNHYKNDLGDWIPFVEDSDGYEEDYQSSPVDFE